MAPVVFPHVYDAFNPVVQGPHPEYLGQWYCNGPGGDIIAPGPFPDYATANAAGLAVVPGSIATAETVIAQDTSAIVNAEAQITDALQGV